MSEKSVLLLHQISEQFVHDMVTTVKNNNKNGENKKFITEFDYIKICSKLFANFNEYEGITPWKAHDYSNQAITKYKESKRSDS